VTQIADSMIEYGWTMPLLIDEDNKIIAGEGRWLAAGLLIERGDLADKKVPCIRATGWSEAQKRAYVIADNKLTENSEWNFDMLAEELAWLDEEGFDLDLTGFDGEELADLLADKNEGLTDPDDVPAVPDDPVTALGDVWLLGVYYECESCGKNYSYAEGKKMQECPCDL
jgi:ParB-like chromosome segregation protein Spo0J